MTNDGGCGHWFGPEDNTFLSYTEQSSRILAHSFYQVGMSVLDGI